MENNLFTKYLTYIHASEKEKKALCDEICKKTGVDITPEEIQLQKKKVTLRISSVKRSILLQRKLEELLISLGYSL